MDERPEQMQKRFLELAERAYQNCTYTFTPFLGVQEQSVFHGMERMLSHVPWEAFGGVEGCERKMVRFGSEELCGYEQPFPIACVAVRPCSAKFAGVLSLSRLTPTAPSSEEAKIGYINFCAVQDARFKGRHRGRPLRWLFGCVLSLALCSCHNSGDPFPQCAYWGLPLKGAELRGEGSTLGAPAPPHRLMRPMTTGWAAPVAEGALLQWANTASFERMAKATASLALLS